MTVVMLILLVAQAATIYSLAQLRDKIRLQDSEILGLRGEVSCHERIHESRHLKLAGKLFKAFAEIDKLRAEVPRPGLRDMPIKND